MNKIFEGVPNYYFDLPTVPGKPKPKCKYDYRRPEINLKCFVYKLIAHIVI